MRTLACLAVALVSLPALAGLNPLLSWQRQNPDASAELGAWARKNPDAAQTLFTWDGDHPERMQQLVDWAIDHPGTDLAAFRTKHQDWPIIETLLDKHHLAANAFLDWCQKRKDAARALVKNSYALEWVGENLAAVKWDAGRKR